MNHSKKNIENIVYQLEDALFDYQDMLEIMNSDDPYFYTGLKSIKTVSSKELTELLNSDDVQRLFKLGKEILKMNGVTKTANFHDRGI